MVSIVLVEPLQIALDLVMSTFVWEEALQPAMSRTLCSPIVSNGVKSLDEKNRFAGTAMYSARTEPILDYMEADSGRVRSSKRRAGLDVWLREICALLNLDSKKDKNGWIPNSAARFLMTRMDWLRHCGQNDFGVVAPGKNLGFFMTLTGIDGSSPWAGPGSHAIWYYYAVREKKLASTLRTEEVIISPWSEFVDYWYWQHGIPEWNWFHRLGYHVYFNLCDMQLRETIALAYKDSLTAGVTAGAGG